MRRVGLFFCTTLFVSSVCVFDYFGAYDVIVKSGRIYDGSGGSSYVANVAIQDDRIAAIGQLKTDADLVIDAQGLAVAPEGVFLKSSTHPVHTGASPGCSANMSGRKRSSHLPRRSGV